jgi:hypothetical protein
MTHRTISVPVGLCVALLLAGCASDDAPPSSTPTDSGQQPATGATASPAPDAEGSDNPGTATLTLGDVTYDFASFRCATGHENTASDVYAFTSDARGQSATGAALQMQANVRDDQGLGRLVGEGVVYEISIRDIDNLDAPSVSFVATSAGSLGSDATLSIDGDSLTGSGNFLDNQQVGADPLAGSLQGTCSSDSRN